MMTDVKSTRPTLNRTMQIFAYADDIAIVSKNIHLLFKTFTDIEVAAVQIGLKINEDKRKYTCLEKTKQYQ